MTMVAGLALALGACGSSGTPTRDGSGDRGDVGPDGAPDTAAASTGAGGTSGAAGAAETSGPDAAPDAVDDAGAGGDAGADSGSDGGAAGTGVNTCATSAPDGGAAGAGACAAGKAECGGAAGDCETTIATDVMNCGRCGRACGAGATCTNGLCSGTVILKPDVSSNWCGAAFSATKAYMITCWGTALSEVRVAPLEPGASVIGTRIKHYTGVPVVAMRGILIDGDSVYYGLEGSPSNLWKFPLDATDATNVVSASAFEAGQRFDSLQLVGDTYWWNHNTHTAGGQVAPSTIEKRAKTGTTSTKVVTLPGVSYALVVTAANLYWLEARTGAGTALYTAPIAGGTVADTKKLGDATGGYLVRQGDYVYWSHKVGAPNGSVMRLKIDDAAATPQPVSTCLNAPTGLVADAGFVYFRQADALYRAPVTGGVPQQLSPAIPAHDQQATQIWHVDDKYVYFGADPGFGTSSLVRVAK
jgi:hypothetical protein